MGLQAVRSGESWLSQGRGEGSVLVLNSVGSGLYEAGSACLSHPRETPEGDNQWPCGLGGLSSRCGVGGCPLVCSLSQERRCSLITCAAGQAMVGGGAE